MGVEPKTKKSSAPKRLIAAAAIVALFAGFAAPASADVVEDLLNKLRDKGIITQDEYDEMLKEMRAEQKAEAMREAQAAADVEKVSKAQAAASSGVKIKIGGFIESATIYRDKNETADVASTFTTKAFTTAAGDGIPFDNTPQAQTPEFRETARQSRLTLLATGNPTDNSMATAYFETDFLGAAQTANSNQSNSYNLRLRQAFATWDQNDWGLHFTGGQAWSLATQYTEGLTPRKENVPATIDAQYVVGFDWLRDPQLRVTKDLLDKKLWLGLSLETPAAIIGGNTPFYFANGASGINAAGQITTPVAGFTSTAVPFLAPITGETAAGGSLFNTANTYTTDTRPDIILKAAADPGWGHYELYGLFRWFTDRVNNPELGPLATAATGSGQNSTTFGEGIGGSVLLPIVRDTLNASGSFLTGNGIGRYGTTQLPDVTYNLNGTYATIHATHFLFGLNYNPIPEWQIWGYYGREMDSQTIFENKPANYPIVFANQVPNPLGAANFFPAGITTFSGYGLPILDNYGCFTNPNQSPGSATNCQGVVSGVQEWTILTWWNFYKGAYGTAKVGLSYSHNTVSTFAANFGAPNPDINIYMLSFRYYPFQ